MQLLSFSERCSVTAQHLQNKGANIQIISADTLPNFGFDRNRFESLISAEIFKLLTKSPFFLYFDFGRVLLFRYLKSRQKLSAIYLFSILRRLEAISYDIARDQSHDLRLNEFLLTSKIACIQKSC